MAKGRSTYMLPTIERLNFFYYSVVDLTPISVHKCASPPSFGLWMNNRGAGFIMGHSLLGKNMHMEQPNCAGLIPKNLGTKSH
jgi:hypothetical protein